MQFGIAFANIGPFVDPAEAVAPRRGGRGRRLRVDLDRRPRRGSRRVPVRVPLRPLGKASRRARRRCSRSADLVGVRGGADLDPAPGHRHPDRAAAQPPRAGQGAGHARPSLGRPDDPRRRHRLAGGGVPGAGGSLRRARAGGPRRPSPPCGPCGPRSRRATRHHHDLSRLLLATPAPRRDHPGAHRRPQRGCGATGRPDRGRILPARGQPATTWPSARRHATQRRRGRPGSGGDRGHRALHRHRGEQALAAGAGTPRSAGDPDHRSGRHSSGGPRPVRWHATART